MRHLLLLVLLLAGARGGPCEECVAQGRVLCFSAAAVGPGGIYERECVDPAQTPFYVGCVNASGCSCVGPEVLGCASCPRPECVWCGVPRHRGAGFCNPNGSSCDAAEGYLTTEKCPVPGIQGWATFVVSIGAGFVLSSVMFLFMWIQERRFRRQQAKVVSSLLENNVINESDLE